MTDDTAGTRHAVHHASVRSDNINFGTHAATEEMVARMSPEEYQQYRKDWEDVVNAGDAEAAEQMYQDNISRAHREQNERQVEAIRQMDQIDQAQEIADNEALRGAYRQILAASVDIAAGLQAAEKALNAMKASAAASQDAVDGKRFDGAATQSVRALSEVVSTATMSDWAEANDNMQAAAQAGLSELAKWRDDEDLVATNNIDPTTLAATNS